MTETLSTSKNRIVTVDALRGIALFGILYAHMLMWYTAGPLPETIYKEMDIASGIAMALFGLLFYSKFFSFFSFLFGLSFYLQMKSLEKKSDNFVLRYGWRLLILGVIGFIHHALWRGDILSIYAPLGFILLFLRKLNNKALIIIGLILISNIPTKLYDAIAMSTDTYHPQSFEKEGQHYYEIVKNGTFWETVKDNWSALDVKLDFQLTTGRLIMTLGFFMLGMYIGRLQWFEKLDDMRPMLKKLCKKIGFFLLGLIGLALLIFLADKGLNLGFQQSQWSGWLFGMIFDFFNSGLTLFYIAGLTILMYKSRWQKIIYPLANIGKMALTSYLMQTFFGLLLFYHFGLGLFTVTTPAINALLCIAIFVLQAYFSKWWLVYFNYGPVEWLWRSLTFFKLPPMLRKNKLTTASSD